MEKINVLISEEELNARICEVAKEISKDYEGKNLHLICILKGGAMFMCELAKRLEVPVSFDFMSVSSYGGGTVSSGIVKIIKDLDESIEGKDLLIVEDIIDTGKTLKYLKEVLYKRKPNSIKICSLLNKPSRRTEQEIEAEYNCFEVPDKFIVGYGLDYDQKYRNLPYIGTMEFE